MYKNYPLILPLPQHSSRVDQVKSSIDTSSNVLFRLSLIYIKCYLTLLLGGYSQCSGLSRRNL